MSGGRLSAAELGEWVLHDPYLPYGYYDDLPVEACYGYRAAQLERMAADPAHHVLIFEEPGSGRALVGLTELAWDTEQFGMKAGRVDYVILRPEGDPGRDWPRGPGTTPAVQRAGVSRIKTPERMAVAAAAARGVARAADELGIRHLTGRFDSRDIPVIQALEGAGFQYADAILRFVIDTETFTPPPAWRPGVELRDAREEDIPVLAGLSGKGFVYDRFHGDPALPPGVADRVHAAWLTNALHGKVGDGTLVGTVDGRVAGFMINALDRHATPHFGRPLSWYVLMTVDQTVRRRGLALALSLGSVAWLKERGALRVEAGTQMANVPASNLYPKVGFHLAQTSVTLRRMGG